MVGFSDHGGDQNVAPGDPLWLRFMVNTFLFKHFKPLHFEVTLRSNLAVAGNWHLGCDYIRKLSVCSLIVPESL